jgi:hypothetical protein
MKSWCSFPHALLLRSTSGKLGVLDRAQSREELDLVQRNPLGAGVLDMLHATVRERVSVRCHGAKHLLQFPDGLRHTGGLPCDLEIVDMDRQDDNQSAVLMPETELGIYLAVLHVAFIYQGAKELHLERARCVSQAGARLVAVKHFRLWVEVFDAWDGLQQRDIRSWQVEVDLTDLLTRELRQFFIGNSLTKGLADVS